MSNEVEFIDEICGDVRCTTSQIHQEVIQFKWSIRNFAELLEDRGITVRSSDSDEPTSSKWSLVVHPRCLIGDEEFVEISLHKMLMPTDCKPREGRCKISLVSSKNKDCHTQTQIKKFIGPAAWRTRRYISRNLLMKKRDILLPNGTLTIKGELNTHYTREDVSSARIEFASVPKCNLGRSLQPHMLNFSVEGCASQLNTMKGGLSTCHTREDVSSAWMQLANVSKLKGLISPPRTPSIFGEGTYDTRSFSPPWIEQLAYVPKFKGLNSLMHMLSVSGEDCVLKRNAVKSEPSSFDTTKASSARMKPASVPKFVSSNSPTHRPSVSGEGAVLQMNTLRGKLSAYDIRDFSPPRMELGNVPKFKSLYSSPHIANISEKKCESSTYHTREDVSQAKLKLENAPKFKRTYHTKFEHRGLRLPLLETPGQSCLLKRKYEGPD